MSDTLQKIQSELKAPKGQYNSFGKYKYRSCEDILEAVKPLLAKHAARLTISDRMIEVGGRVYVEATCHLAVDGIIHQVTACARESETKKGMDDGQITGSTSSYARKYALNGLFLIDDTKDADTNEQRTQVDSASAHEKESLDKLKDDTKTCNSIDELAALFDEKRSIINNQDSKVRDWFDKLYKKRCEEIVNGK